MLRPSGAMLSSVTGAWPPIQAAEELGRDGGSGAVGAVGDDLQAGEREAGNGIDEELNVVGLKGGIVFDGRKRCGIGDVDLRGVVQDLVFHGQFDRVGQLESVAAEELDAVVLPGIVRGGDDDAGVEAVRAREKRDGRSGDDAGAFDIARRPRAGPRREWRRSTGWTRACRGRG